MVKDTYTYLIQIHGQVSENEINSLSPLRMTVEGVEANATRLTLCTDQSGLVGLLRHLHGLGFVFLSITRIDQPGSEN